MIHCERIDVHLVARASNRSVVICRILILLMSLAFAAVAVFPE